MGQHHEHDDHCHHNHSHHEHGHAQSHKHDHPHKHGGHGHVHLDPSLLSEKKLTWAVIANVVLTLAQIIGGLISGSLSLVADALHNLSDAAALFLALIAIRIGRKPADNLKTFGYQRAETIAALINLTSLVIVGAYLLYEAIVRFFSPEPIAGWIIVYVAAIALVVDCITALLTYSQSKNSMNMRAAFLHNVTDALASVGVIISGACIILFDWYWTDSVMTLLIAGYVLKQAWQEMPGVIHLLMEGTPKYIEIPHLQAEMEKTEGVKSIHHMHLWHIDEKRIALEAHVVLDQAFQYEETKQRLKTMLSEKFHIDHSTLEFEYEVCEHREC